MRLIDADAFKDYIRDACEDMKHLYKDNGAWAKEITESFCKDIDEQPTVETETPRIRGKWIYNIDDLFPAESTMECNQCHAEQPLICDDEFCPHCGAKMDGEVTE